MATYARGKKWADAGSEVQKVWNADIQPEDRKFELVADFEMTGDQPTAVARLATLHFTPTLPVTLSWKHCLNNWMGPPIRWRGRRFPTKPSCIL